MDVKKLRSVIQDLEIKKGVKLQELEAAKKEADDLGARVESYFGTRDPEKLAGIEADLEAKLAESMAKLKEMGVEV